MRAPLDRRTTSNDVDLGSACRGPTPFELIVLSLAGSWDPSLPIAASRANATGLLDLTLLRDQCLVSPAVERMTRLGRDHVGLVLDSRFGDVENAAIEALSGEATVLLMGGTQTQLAAASERCRAKANRIGFVTTSQAEATLAEEL